MQPQGSDLAESLVQDCNSGDTKLHVTKQARPRLINQRKLQKSCRAYFPSLGEPRTPYLASVKRKGSLGSQI